MYLHLYRGDGISMIKKDYVLQVRLTEKQREQLQKFAEKKYMNMSDYVRYCLMKESLRKGED